MQRFARVPLVLTLAGLSCAAAATPPAAFAAGADDPTLVAAIDRRFGGDRTGACLAVAVIDGDRVRRAFRCADPASKRVGPGSAFEIGSVSKTMTATLLALQIGEGKANLDDPLAAHLPSDARVPGTDTAPIRLRHVVTHTSGLPVLPPGVAIPDPEDPYAAMAPADVQAALARTTPAQPPGARMEYSNFASMLLSWAVSRTGGAPLDAQLRARLFAPLGMDGAYVVDAPDGVRPAMGHLQTGASTAPWTFDRELAGVGGVRATLDDMVRYVQAQLGDGGGADLRAAIALTHAPVEGVPAAGGMGMNWMRRPFAGATLLAHEGGTGGFSSLVAFVPAQRRGVVVLSDTSLTALGGLGAFGLHLLDPAQPPGEPRRSVDAPPALLAALAGRYRLPGGLDMVLRVRDGRLVAQAAGQPEFELAHDSAGDFHPRAFDALLTPQRLPGGGTTFDWSQGGGRLRAERVGDGPRPAAAPATPPSLDDYVGVYPLVPGFALTVTARDGRLYVQGTGQSAGEVQHAEGDAFVAPAFGAEFRFERGPGGRVAAVTLLQAGQRLRGERQAAP